MRKDSTTYDAPLQKRVIYDDLFGFGVDVAILHTVDTVVDGHIDTSHHPLIVPEEEDGQAGDTVDGDEKLSLLIPVDNVVLRDEIHDSARFRPVIDRVTGKICNDEGC